MLQMDNAPRLRSRGETRRLTPAATAVAGRCQHVRFLSGKRCFLTRIAMPLLCVAGITVAAVASARAAETTTAAPVVVLSLGGDWAFAYTVGRTEQVPPARAFGATMPVPGCWDDWFDRAKALRVWPFARFNPDFRPTRFPMDKMRDASLSYLLGTGWYRRQLDVPAAWKGRQVTLQVGRVVMETWVYVNGREVHHHLGHSTSWEVPLGSHLEFGRRNELVIAVDNTRTDRLGCTIRGFQGRSGGIFGPVTIRLAGPARIANVYVFPDQNRLHWRVELQGDLPKAGQLQWRILAQNAKQVLASGTQTVAGEQTGWNSGTFGLKPWSDRQPNLYRLEVALHAGEDCLDVCRQPFGFRRLTAAGTGLRLNDRPIFLRGVADHSYFPLTCTPPMEAGWYRGHIRRLKEIGFNWLRFHTSVPLEPYLEAADELGMLIQVEPPVGYALPEWRDILRACRKHPSVAIYCCGNEELLDETRIEYLRQCAAEMRTAAPDALLNPQEALRGVEYVWAPTDLGGDAVQQPFPHNPMRLAKLKEFSDVFGQYTWGWLSYTSLLGEPDKIDRRLALYGRPCLAHELGICGCYLDLSLEERYRKLRIGPDLYAAARQELQKAGLLDRAGVYYRNSAAWQRLMLKDAMETARQCRLVAGYDCLGANDAHWIYSGYGCGMLNEFDELKPGRSADDILGYNGESVLLVSRQRERNLVSGQPLRRDLLLSWFGDGTLRRAAVRWSFSVAGGAALAGGEQAVPAVEAGAVARIAAIDAPTPKLDRPMKATLTVELVDAGYRLRNHWDYWLFPAGEPVVPENVHVVAALDAATIKELAAGRRVVLLGVKPFPARAMDFQMGLAGRPQGNLATVIARHPLTDRFPHDGYCDWQFWKMFSDATAVQFDEMPEAFDPILEVVSSYKQVHRQAAVFEWRVGKGRLLVCSLSLPTSDPAAAYFRRSLLAYAAGEQFQPRTQVAPERLEQLLKLAPTAVKPAANPNQAFDEQSILAAPIVCQAGERFEGRFYRGRGNVEYLQLLEIAGRMFAPDPEFQNIGMFYKPAWNGLVEGPTWEAWWIQNSYGPTYCALPFLSEPLTTFLQNSHDLWFDQMGDGRTVRPFKDFHWIPPDGCLCDAAAPGMFIAKQGDGRVDIHDWCLEFTAAGLMMQAELLLVGRDAKAIDHYLPKLRRCANFIESRRDPKNNLFLAGPAGNLLAPSYAGWKKPDGTYDKAYLAGLSITYIAGLDRLIELEKLAGNAENVKLYSERRDLARKGLPLLTTDEGYFIKSLDPDGTKHGVYGAAKHGYFEAVANHDAICFRVADDAQAEKIYAKIASIPGLRRHDLIITNCPGLDDMYVPDTDWLWKFGTWVNGGEWTTCEARMMMGYCRLGKYDAVRRSMKKILDYARRFRMDNPLVDFGNAVYQPKEPINCVLRQLGRARRHDPRPVRVPVSGRRADDPAAHSAGHHAAGTALPHPLRHKTAIPGNGRARTGHRRLGQWPGVEGV